MVSFATRASLLFLVQAVTGQGIFDFFRPGGGASLFGTTASYFGPDPWTGAGSAGGGGGYHATTPETLTADARLTNAEEQMAEVLGEAPKNSQERRRMDNLIRATGGQFSGDAAPLNYLVEEYLMTTPGPARPQRGEAEGGGGNQRQKGGKRRKGKGQNQQGARRRGNGQRSQGGQGGHQSQAGPGGYQDQFGGQGAQNGGQWSQGGAGQSPRNNGYVDQGTGMQNANQVAGWDQQPQGNLQSSNQGQVQYQYQDQFSAGQSQGNNYQGLVPDNKGQAQTQAYSANQNLNYQEQTIGGQYQNTMNGPSPQTSQGSQGYTSNQYQQPKPLSPRKGPPPPQRRRPQLYDQQYQEPAPTQSARPMKNQRPQNGPYREQQYQGPPPAQYKDPAPAQNQGPPPTQYRDPAPTQYNEPAPAQYNKPAPAPYRDPAHTQYQGPSPAQYQDSKPTHYQGPPPAQYQDQAPVNNQGRPPAQFQDQTSTQYQGPPPPRYQNSKPGQATQPRKQQLYRDQPPIYQSQNQNQNNAPQQRQTYPDATPVQQKPPMMPNQPKRNNGPRYSNNQPTNQQMPPKTISRTRGGPIAANRLRSIQNRIRAVNDELQGAIRNNDLARVQDLQNQLDSLNGVRLILTGASGTSGMKTITGSRRPQGSPGPGRQPSGHPTEGGNKLQPVGPETRGRPQTNARKTMNRVHSRPNIAPYQKAEPPVGSNAPVPQTSTYNLPPNANRPPPRRRENRRRRQPPVPAGTTVAPKLGDIKWIGNHEYIYTDADGYDTFQWVKKKNPPPGQQGQKKPAVV